MTTIDLPQLHSLGHPLDMDPDKVGLMRDSSDAADDATELRRRLAADGYLYMRGCLDRDQVLNVRSRIVSQLHDQGALDPAMDPMDAVASADAQWGLKADLATSTPELAELLYQGALPSFYRSIFGEDVRHYDYTWLRAMGPGKGTSVHCDLPYMGRGTHSHLTCWVPYGDVPLDLGGLLVLEGSHRRMDLLENYVYRDVDAYCENDPRQRERASQGKWSFTGALSSNPPLIRNKFGGKWVTAPFQAGDFVTFGMFLVHASLDNRTENSVRISSDCRFQRASEPLDERWIGEKPPAHSTAAKHGRIC